MKVTFENPDKINGLMTITVEEADYQEKVEKKLKELRHRANVPGFRPGQVPMGMIKRQYGSSVKLDEINKLLGESLMKYVQENNIQMLGEPMPSEQQTPVDIEAAGPYDFMFDIAVAPEIKIALSGDDQIDYYDIVVDDKIIDRQVEAFAQQSGDYSKVEDYQDNDMLKGDMRELDADGNTKEDGITVEAAVLLPSYIKDEEQKKLFEGSKLGDILTFNPRKAYASDAEFAALLKMKKEEVAGLESDFSFQITEISRYTKAEVNQKLFDRIYGEGKVNSEEEFRKTIADGLKSQFVGSQDFRFMQDLRTYCEQKVGQLEYPEAILKRVMLNNNKDKGADFVEKNFEASIKELNWHLIKEELVRAFEVKVDDNDMKQAAMSAARAQFAQYGMNNMPDEYLEKYAQDMLKKKEYVDNLLDRCIDGKLSEKLKNVVKLNVKSISLDDFNKLMEG